MNWKFISLISHYECGIIWGLHSASHPVAPGLNPASPEIFYLLLSLWTVENSNLSSEGISRMQLAAKA